MLYNYWKLKWAKIFINFILILKSVINYIWKKKKKKSILIIIFKLKM